MTDEILVYLHLFLFYFLRGKNRVCSFHMQFGGIGQAFGPKSIDLDMAGLYIVIPGGHNLGPVQQSISAHASCQHTYIMAAR
jgi:hypothetical protein